MGIMIQDPVILAQLTKLAEQMGTTKAEALRIALRREADRIGLQAPGFPRDRVTYKTYRI